MEVPNKIYISETPDELEFNPHDGEFEALLYSPSHRFLGVIRHESALLAFLCKVKESESEGYYIVYKEKKYPIDKYGKTSVPIHFIDDYLSRLVGF